MGKWGRLLQIVAGSGMIWHGAEHIHSGLGYLLLGAIALADLLISPGREPE